MVSRFNGIKQRLKIDTCYLRVKISSGLTEEIVYFPYYAELIKAEDYKLGEVIYK